MSTTPQVWTVETLIRWQESTGKITPPFTDLERSLARAAAEAYYFWAELTELPARAPWNSAAWGAMFLGIYRVQKRRKGECKDDLYNVPQKLDHPISLEEGHWGERNDDDVTAAAQWRV